MNAPHQADAIARLRDENLRLWALVEGAAALADEFDDVLGQMGAFVRSHPTRMQKLRGFVELMDSAVKDARSLRVTWP